MWSIFSRDPAKDFAYVLGEKVAGLEEKSVWSLHNGKKKANGDPVSIFVFDVKASSESQTALARSSFKRIKTLRHPNILTFLDGIETDKVIYIATEPVTPLEVYIENNDSAERHNQLAISWGLHKVTKGLSFLINDCNLIHNNVCMSSIFVDQAGEWKLGGVDYMYPATGTDSIPPVKILPYLERYDPPEKTDLRRGIKGEKWSSDMWGLGCLIWEVFNGSLPRTSSLKAFGNIPKNLVANYCELVGANPSSRPNPAKFIQDCCKQGGFMNNPFVKTMLFLEEIQIKEPAEKAKFFTNLTNALDTFPKQLSRFKVLPQLLQAYEFGSCGAMVLAPLFKVGKLLDHEEYQAKIVPCVVKLFSSADRNTRVKLLQQIEMFVEYLPSQTVNDKIFPSVVGGFLDTNPVVRESTIRAMLYLAPKLSYKNLNEELMKHFARLQAKDDQGGIRTNTTVCLGKIATYLNPQMRQKILCSAFLRALKDPFPPARQAGIIGMGVSQNLFTLADSCHKLMPPLCTCLMDPEKQVRDQAFKTLKGFLERLEKVSENPDLQQEIEKDVMSGGVADTSAAGWAGWAIGGVSNLTSKVYSKAKNPTPGSQPAMSGQPPSGSQPQTTTVPTGNQPSPVTKQKAPPEEPMVEEEEGEGWDDDGDWGDIEVPSPSPAPSSNVRSPSEESSRVKPTTDDNWDTNDWGAAADDDEDWGSLEETGPSASKKSISQQMPSSDNSSASQKQSTKSDSDWGWGGDSSQSSGRLSSDNSSSKPVKGALKLGSQKKTTEPDYGWIEEEFAPIEDSSVKPASSYNWGSSTQDTGFGAGDDFFTSLAPSSQSKPKKPASSRSTPSSDTPPRQDTPPMKAETGGGGGEGGWDDGDGWGGDSWADLNDSKESVAERKKQEREEKKRQKQQELAQKREAKKSGAMKLGAKKLAAD